MIRPHATHQATSTDPLVMGIVTKTPSVPHFYASATLSFLVHHLHLSVLHHCVRHAKQAHAAAFRLGLADHPILSNRLILVYSLHHRPPLARLVFDVCPDKTNVFLWNSILAAYSRNHLFRDAISLFRSMIAHSRPDDYTLAIASKASGEVEDVWFGRKVHSLTMKLGFRVDPVVMNSLMGMYFRCGKTEDGHGVFDEMPCRNAAAWNGFMFERLNSGGRFSIDEVWNLFMRMQLDGLKPDKFTISMVLSFLNRAASQDLLFHGRELHNFSVKNGFDLDCHVGTCLIDMYSKCENVITGRRVFDRMVHKNVVVWTAMITSYVKNGDFEEAVLLFRMMQLKDGTVPNKVTLLTMLSAVGSLASYAQGKEIHGYATKFGLYGEASLNNALIDMYFKCGSLDSAKKVFGDNSWDKDVISWGSMIYGYGVHGKGEEAVALFQDMCHLGLKMNHITYTSVISACGRSGLIAEGFDIYNALVEGQQVIPTVEICSSMVDMLCRAGQLDKALQFIKSMPMEPGPSVWGALFDSAVFHGNCEIQDLAYNFLLRLEPENPSNLVTLSNSLASSRRWDMVLNLRNRMKKDSFQKVSGCSWICVDNAFSYFFVADKYHQNSKEIYEILHDLILVMKEASYEQSC